MEQKTMQKIDIKKILKDFQENEDLSMYWDYQDKLSEEQIWKIISEEEGLNDVENELWEYNLEYISEVCYERLENYFKENNLNFEEFKETDEYIEVMQELEGSFNFNLKDLLRNSEARIRVELLSNEDMICFVDDVYKGSETIKAFKKRFKGHYKKEDLDKEINNMVNDYGLFAFYFKVKGNDILRLREDYQNGFINLSAGLEFGIFNSWIGGGSVLEMELTKDIKLNIKDWRFENNSQEVIEKLKEKSDYGYYSLNVCLDTKGYGVQQVYCLTGDCWKDY